MRRSFKSALLATALAIAALLVSQFIWIQSAIKQSEVETKSNFQTCFNQSISSLINEYMGRNVTASPYKIEPIDEEKEESRISPEQKDKAIDAGYTTDGTNVSVMIENALLAMMIRDDAFSTFRLDTLITTSLSEKVNVLSSVVTLHELDSARPLDNCQSLKNLFFEKTYIAERKIDIPLHTYIIRGEYTLKQPRYLQDMSIATLISLIASVFIVFVLFYLLAVLRRKQQEVQNLERSFHGAIHDLKSPLAYVYFKLSAMEEKETDMTKKLALTLTGQRVNYLTDKIMRLLKMGKSLENIGDADKQPVFLYETIEQIEPEIRTMFPAKQIELKNNVSVDLSLWGVSDLLEATIRILIENAVKYNTNPPLVQISAKEQGSGVIINIADNGVGIPARQIKNIFKPYYTSNSKSGTGIGLYYAMRIVKAHGGNITAKSVPNQGSSFTIILPQKI